MIYAEFKLSNLFDKVQTKRIKGNMRDYPKEKSEGYDLPARTAGVNNLGLSVWVPREEATVLNNKISIGSNGAFSAFYHSSDFTILHGAYALDSKNFELNENIAMYIIGLLYNTVSDKYSWSNGAKWDKLKEESVNLPIRVNNNLVSIIDEKRVFNEVGYIPDFDYMSKYIEDELSKLKSKRIEELEQYLVATGLNDYELTEEDLKILSLSGFGDYEERDSKDAVKVCKEFKLDDLFTKKTMKGYSKIDENLEENPNGYYVYGQNIQRQYPQKVLLDSKYLHIVSEDNPILAYASSVGEIGMICESFYRSGNNGAFQGLFSKHHQFNKYELQFILSILRKYFDNFGYTTGMAHIMDLTFPLPIQTDTDNNPIIDTECKYHKKGYIPDWDFMEKYIRAIEKVVIADVENKVKTNKNFIVRCEKNLQDMKNFPKLIVEYAKI